MKTHVRLMVLWLFSLSCAASEITIYTHISPGWASGNNEGFGEELLNRIFQNNELEVSIEVLPPRRSLLSLAQNQNSCMFGGNSAELKRVTNIDTVESTSVSTGRMHVYSRPPVVFQTLASLESANVAYPAGAEHVLSRVILDNSGSIAVETTENAFLMLRAGRVDAVIAFSNALVGFDATEFIYDESFWLWESATSLSCRLFPENWRVIEFMNQRFEKGLMMGEFDDLYDNYKKPKPSNPQ